MKPLSEIIRPQVLALLAEQNARPQAIQAHGARPAAEVLRLHLAENPYGEPLNRFPDPIQWQARSVVGKVLGNLPPANVSLSAGVIAGIDTLLRLCIVPGRDNLIISETSLPQFSRAARLVDAECRTIRLKEDLSIDLSAIPRIANANSKLLFLSSPAYPTGQVLNPQDLTQLCNTFPGLVVIDESFTAYARCEPFIRLLPQLPNLVVLHSLSAEYALAGVPVAVLCAGSELIAAIEAIRPTYNLNQPALEALEKLTRRRFDADKWTKQVLEERPKLMSAILQLPFCEKVYPTAANFFLARFLNATAVAAYLQAQGILVDNTSSLPGLENCLCITVGSPSDNNKLVGALRRYTHPAH